MKRKLLLFTVSFLLLSSLTAKGQELTVTGTITSVDDEMPLPGVNIMVEGTSTGTITNFDGEYSIDVPSGNSTLVFTSVGFGRQEIPVNGRSNIDVKMQAELDMLDEVVVTAFGIEREKKALGYSVQEVNAEELTQAREVNVANSLKGKVAGVHVNATSGGPGGSSYVVIRGNSSLSGNNQPLYVVDGIPIDNQTLDPANIRTGVDYGDGIANINPDDIKSISVLKGPSSAAMYGARGANGVILITTKTGKRQTGIGVDINSNLTFEKINVIPTFQNRWGLGYGGEYPFDTEIIDGQETFVLRGGGDQWGGEMLGQPIIHTYAPEWGVQSYSPQPEDNISKFYETGTTLSNTIGISGGNENSSMRLSLGDMQNESIVPNSSFSRQTITLRAAHQVSDNLSVDAKVNYVRQQGNNRVQNGIYFSTIASSLNVMPRHIDLAWLKDFKREDGLMTNWKSGSPYNPYWLANEFVNEDTRDRMIGMARVTYDFTDWLSIQARTGTDFYTDNRFSRIGQGSPGVDNINGQVRNDIWQVKEENSDVLLTATGDISSDFSGSFSVGANHLNFKREVVGVSGRNLDIPDLYHINNAALQFTRNFSERKKMNSVYFLGQIAYKNYLFIDVTGRNDWSSTLGLNKQSFFYPSVSTSFAFTDAWDVDSDLITFGKLRASYAEAGNDASPYQTQGGYNLSNNTFNGLRLATISGTVPLSDLKNELTTAYEVGVDLRLLNNRLGIDFTYYNQISSNQILPVEISSATGFGRRLINAGEIRNKGFELMVNATLLKAGDFTWDMSVNLSNNKSEVVSLVPGIDSHQLHGSIGGASIQARVGEAYGNIIGFPFMRNEEGRKVVSAQGKWQRADEMEILGNIQPDFLGGLTNTFSYKGFQLSGLLDVRKGGQIYSYTKYDQMAKGTGKFTEERDNLIADGVIENEDGTFRENDIVILAQDYYAGGGPWGNIGESHVIDADYVALRELTLGYNFNPEIINKTPFTKIRISVVGRNLAYLYRDQEFKDMGVSPETAFSSDAAAQGFEARGLPTTRSIGTNISLSF